jgi:hypothetical protein
MQTVKVLAAVSPKLAEMAQVVAEFRVALDL